MWVKLHKKQLVISLLVAGVICIVFIPSIAEAIFTLLFTGGLPNTQFYVPALVMLLLWTVVGIAFVLWAYKKIVPGYSSVPTSGKAFYHKASSKKPVRGRKITTERAVRRRYRRLPASS